MLYGFTSHLRIRLDFFSFVHTLFRQPKLRLRRFDCLLFIFLVELLLDKMLCLNLLLLDKCYEIFFAELTALKFRFDYFELEKAHHFLERAIDGR